MKGIDKKIILAVVTILLLVAIGLAVYFLVFKPKSSKRNPVFSISGCKQLVGGESLDGNWYNMSGGYISEDGKLKMIPATSDPAGYNICSTVKGSATYACTPQKRAGFVASENGKPKPGNTVMQWDNYGSQGKICGELTYF